MVESRNVTHFVCTKWEISGEDYEWHCSNRSLSISLTQGCCQVRLIQRTVIGWVWWKVAERRCSGEPEIPGDRQGYRLESLFFDGAQMLHFICSDNFSRKLWSRRKFGSQIPSLCVRFKNHTFVGVDYCTRCVRVCEVPTCERKLWVKM
jgi:hypothetical protein